MKICYGFQMELLVQKIKHKTQTNKPTHTNTGAEADFRNKLGLCLGDICVSDDLRSKFPFKETHFWNDGRMKSSGWKTWLTHPSPNSTRVPLSQTKLNGFNVGPTEFIVISENNAKKLRMAWIAGQKSIPKLESVKFETKSLKIHRWKKDESPISFK